MNNCGLSLRALRFLRYNAMIVQVCGSQMMKFRFKNKKEKLIANGKYIYADIVDIDVNVYQSNIFHTKMLIKELQLQNYLFNTDVYELPPKKRLDITDSLRREMIEIFSGENIY